MKNKSLTEACTEALKSHREIIFHSENESKNVKGLFQKSLNTMGRGSVDGSNAAAVKKWRPSGPKYTSAIKSLSKNVEPVEEKVDPEQAKLQGNPSPSILQRVTSTIQDFRTMGKQQKLKQRLQDLSKLHGNKSNSVEEGFDDHKEIAKKLADRHGAKNVKPGHVKDFSKNERDSNNPLDHDEVMHHVKKITKEEKKEDIQMINFEDWLKKVKQIDEKSEQARSNKMRKNLMDTSRGAKWKLNNPDQVPDREPGHTTAQAHNKAIGRALRSEEVEQIDELSQKTLKSYINKNIKSGRADNGDKGDTGLYTATKKVAQKQETSTLDKKVNKLGKTSSSSHKNPYEYEAARSELKNRGIHHFAGDRTRTEEVELEEVEQIDETWKSLKKTKANLDAIRQAGNKVIVQHGEGDTIYRVLKQKKNENVKEEVEQIDELSKKTLGSYVSKAKDSLSKNRFSLGSSMGADHATGGKLEKYNKDSRRKEAENRSKGIDRAVDRLTKEGSEQIDELSKELKARYIGAATRDLHKRGADAVGLISKFAKAREGGKEDAALKPVVKHIQKSDKRMKNVEKVAGQLAKEEADSKKKQDVPFDGPYTNVKPNVKDKSGAVHTPASRAKHLAKQAMNQQQAKEQVELDQVECKTVSYEDFISSLNEISAGLALRASKAAEVKRGQLAQAGDKEGAAEKAKQSSRLYRRVGGGMDLSHDQEKS